MFLARSEYSHKIHIGVIRANIHSSERGTSQSGLGCIAGPMGLPETPYSVASKIFAPL